MLTVLRINFGNTTRAKALIEICLSHRGVARVLMFCIPQYTDNGIPQYTDNGTPQYTDNGIPQYTDNGTPQYTDNAPVNILPARGGGVGGLTQGNLTS